MSGNIHIGISGWSYWDWKGVFYPESMRSTDWLSFYAKEFDTTEINSSFYHMPRLKTATTWADKVPAGFKFCPKISKYLTHNKRLKEPEEPLQRFFEAFSQIKEYLGPVLIQLPPSLKFDAETVQYFFEILKTGYNEYHFALEARHATWLEADAAKLMKQYNIAWVISQSGVDFPYLEQVTADTVYIRFHGPGKLYASSYTDEQMKEYAGKIKKWAKKHDVWIYFNNCYNGVAIENANTLRKYVK
ncbi:MAG: hypothetical protein K0Q79_2107 [Flavipsychrobacter sp.]|jgi:uncharacterized protein YecE (DUF72 family)|nr:hypothetical protein [Flavipsychrobacter sp.]